MGLNRLKNFLLAATATAMIGGEVASAQGPNNWGVKTHPENKGDGVPRTIYMENTNMGSRQMPLCPNPNVTDPEGSGYFFQHMQLYLGSVTWKECHNLL